MNILTLDHAGLRLRLTDYGASALQLYLNAFPFSLLCALPDEQYPQHTQHFGAVAGPIANRIANAHAVIEGQVLSLEANDGKHSLHSGSNGLGRRQWDIHHHDNKQAIFSYQMQDGECGLPGNRQFFAHYELFIDPRQNCPSLLVELSMISDQPTFCNLAFHPYFCLDSSGSILNHHLYVNADHFLPTDNDKIPTGEQRKLAQHLFDFSTGDELKKLASKDAPVLDHNFCLNPSNDSLSHAASLSSKLSEIEMNVFTNQPGLQIYCPAALASPLVNENHQTFKPFPSICLEPQKWPDAPNHPHFPSIHVSKNMRMTNRTVFTFTSSE